MHNFFYREKGISILGIFFFGFILILVLSYFNVSIEAVVESPQTKDNLSYVVGASRSVWNDYLRSPVAYFWKDVLQEIIWPSFIRNMKRIRDGEPTDLELNAPTVDL